MVALRIVDRKAEAMVRAALNLAGLEAFLREVTTQACNVVGREGYVVHPVAGFGIGRGAVSNPLLAGHVASGLAGLDGRSRSQAQNVRIELFHAIGIGRVERDVVNAGDAWARSTLGERNGREDCGDE